MMSDDDQQNQKKASQSSNNGDKEAKSEGSENTSEQSVTERAENLVGRVREGVTDIVKSENGTSDPSAERTERADEIVDELGERFGKLAAEAAYRLRVASERAREEAEDIWAEAQDLHRKWKQE
jgi:hypothetical protein